jgi:hypothetical protein
MVSDPVRGLARRWGSVMQDETVIGDYTPEDYADLLADTANHAVLNFFVDGVEYDLIYRTVANASGSGSFAFCFNKVTKQFIPVVIGGGTTTPALISGGVSAATNIGKYIFLAGNEITPSWSPTTAWEDPDNASKIVAWVRGGAYSRTFKLTLTKLDNTQIVAEYKTVSASYPTLLDTSDILTEDPPGTPNELYQKQINDRTYAYNSEVTKWIGTAAADITPENIAQKLVDDLVAQGVTGVSRVEGTVVIDNALFKEATGDDNGDGSLFRVVGQEITAPDLVSSIHYVGKVIKIRPKATTPSTSRLTPATRRQRASPRFHGGKPLATR